LKLWELIQDNFEKQLEEKREEEVRYADLPPATPPVRVISLRAPLDGYIDEVFLPTDQRSPILATTLPEFLIGDGSNLSSPLLEEVELLLEVATVQPIALVPIPIVNTLEIQVVPVELPAQVPVQIHVESSASVSDHIERPVQNYYQFRQSTKRQAHDYGASSSKKQKK